MIIVDTGITTDLVNAINSADRLIYIKGNYELNASLPANRLISKVRGRKIVGIDETSKITFTNIPNGSLQSPIVCFDFQSKARLYNIKFDFNPNLLLASNINIIGIRFKRILTHTYQSVGIGSSFSDLPTVDIIDTNSLRISGPTIGITTISINSLATTKYYFEIRNPSNTTPKEAYSFFSLNETEVSEESNNSSSYEWLVDQGEDEADMDSSLSRCTLSFKSNTPLTTYSNRSVVGVDYYGRNLSCDSCIFNNLGTSIKIQFPPTDTLSSPGSIINPYQSGYYGHRKCSISRNTFNTSFTSIFLTGFVTIRGMLVYNNTVNNGQLLFCNGLGGIKSSLITQNIINNNITDENLKSALLISNGLFVDNSINNNTFTGSIDVSVSIATTTNYNNIFSNNSFNHNRKNVFVIKKTDSICITNNRFESLTSQDLITIRGSSKNLNISFNTLVGVSSSNFISLRDSQNNTGQIHSRVVITKNKSQSGTNVQLLSNSSPESYISQPYFIQNSL
jgi:hypothetical protein